GEVDACRPSGVRVVGAAMTSQATRDHEPADLAAAAVAGALADAGLQPDRVAMVLLSNAGGATLCDQECVRGQVWLRGLGLGPTPIVNVENACAGGASAFHLGCLAAQLEIGPVLVVGVEKMWSIDRTTTLRAIEGCLAADERPRIKAELANE